MTRRFIKIDYTAKFSSVCYSEEEVISGCGYEGEGLTFDEVVERVKGEYEIIEVTGDVNFLTDDE